MNNFLANTIFTETSPFEKCSIHEIENFEQKFSIMIPDDYKTYLHQFNGAKPINYIIKNLNENGGGTVLHHMYGLNTSNRYAIKIENDMLLFAEDAFGNEFAINLNTKENYGCIYFIDRETDETFIINKSFTDFISSLISHEVFMDNLKTDNPEIYERIQELKKNPQI